MRYTLKDYQNDVVVDVLARLGWARDDWHERKSPVAFSLTATTGAGKTVMAAAVIEALFDGNQDHNFDSDPGAVVLWFTDDPSLNEQTRFRLMGRRRPDRPLAPGQGSAQHDLPMPDARAFTMWDTLANTIVDEHLTLYLILDEAHRGMKPPSKGDRAEKATIVQRLVNGAAKAIRTLRAAAAAPTDRVIGLSPLQIQRRFTAAARAAGIEARLTAHSGRVGLASELTAREKKN